MPTIQDQAVCVRHWDWSETSQTVSLMTREHGLIRCLAKGSKREKSAFSGGLELATHGTMNAITKPTTDLALLTSWDLLNPMHAIRTSLQSYNASMMVIDLIPRMINDHDPHPELFDALLETLNRVCDPNRALGEQELHAQLVWYLWNLVLGTGAQPELMIDVVSGELFDEDRQVFGFSTTLGGLTRDPKQLTQSSMDVLSDAYANIVRVRKSTVDVLRRFRSGEQPEDFHADPTEQIKRAGALLALYIRDRIGANTPSLGMIYPID